MLDGYHVLVGWMSALLARRRLHRSVDARADGAADPRFRRDPRSLAPLDPHLARDYRVLRIDRRGFGKSDPMPVDFAWSLDRMVDDTVSFIEAQAPAGAHIIAAKIGTPLSIRLAVRRPDLVEEPRACAAGRPPGPTPTAGRATSRSMAPRTMRR